MPAQTAFIARVRTDIDAGTLQWTDLKPNSSQYIPSLESGPQTGYLGTRVANDTVLALAGGTTTTAEFVGLAAYIIDNCIDLVSGVTITVARANAVAIALIARLDAGSTISATDFTAAVVAAGGGAGTTISAGGSTGTLVELLKVISGATYTLPTGSLVGGLAAAANLGTLDTTTMGRQIYVTGALQISCGEGQLAAYADNTFSYGGTTGRALVVYDSLGALIS